MNKYLIQAPPPGVYTNIPDAEYHSWDAFSASMAKKLAAGPEDLKYYMDTMGEDKPSASMIKGTMTHTLCLQPDKVNDYLAIMPGKMKRGTKAHKAWLADECGARQDISQTENEAAINMSNALHENRKTRKILAALDQHELSIVFHRGGVVCKARIDGVITRFKGGMGLIVDIKTARDSTVDGFARAVNDYRYDLQAAHYLNAANSIRKIPREFYFLVVQNTAPWKVEMYDLPPAMLQAAHDEMDTLYAQYKHCTDTGEWGTPQGDGPVTIPCGKIVVGGGHL